MAAPRKAWEVSTSLRPESSSRRRENDDSKEARREGGDTKEAAAEKKVRLMVKESLVTTCRGRMSHPDRSATWISRRRGGKVRTEKNLRREVRQLSDDGSLS